MSELENQDVFSDEAEVTTESEAATKEEVKDESTKVEETEEQGTEATTQQGEEGAEPPAADGDNKVQDSDKMIPEHRFKAALKDVKDKLSNAEAKIAELTATPPPDKAKDPEAYERHVRLEMSRTIMSETHEDYNDKIAHFQEMAKANPMLNQVVAESPMPAKMAYDLAVKDLEITELAKLKDDPEMKEFKAWKAEKAKQADPAKQLELKKTSDAASKVPNLNRNLPSAKRAQERPKSEDDGLFEGHHNKWA